MLRLFRDFWQMLADAKQEDDYTRQFKANPPRLYPVFVWRLIAKSGIEIVIGSRWYWLGRSARSGKIVFRGGPVNMFTLTFNGDKWYGFFTLTNKPA